MPSGVKFDGIGAIRQEDCGRTAIRNDDVVYEYAILDFPFGR